MPRPRPELEQKAAILNTPRLHTATGAHALSNNTTGHDNVANGYLALGLNNTGYQNTAIGGGGTTPIGLLTGTLLNNTTGFRNTATGFQAL